MTHGWTTERSKKQSERIREWKPWEKSTGPKTELGKAKTSKNAFKHGMRSAEIQELHDLLAEFKRTEKEACKWMRTYWKGKK